VLQPLKNAATLLADMAKTRLELAATEVDEERLRLVGMAWSACIALLAWAMAVSLAVLFLIVLMWDVNRLATIGLLGLLFSALGAWMTLRLKAQSASKPPFLGATLTELKLDLEALRGRAAAGESHD
jgi:uncharacterized membrane protein YqjE